MLSCLSAYLRQNGIPPSNLSSTGAGKVADPLASSSRWLPPNDKKGRVECCYPTQAKVRLEWGTQPSLLVPFSPSPESRTYFQILTPGRKLAAAR
jgi:hypothetical protein